MLRTMADAYKVQALAGAAPDRVEGAARGDAGAAEALGLGDEIGTLDASVADVCVWDWAVGPVARRRMEVARECTSGFAWITLGDERNLAETWVGGVRRYRRGDDNG